MVRVDKRERKANAGPQLQYPWRDETSKVHPDPVYRQTDGILAPPVLAPFARTRSGVGRLSYQPGSSCCPGCLPSPSGPRPLPRPPLPHSLSAAWKMRWLAGAAWDCSGNWEGGAERRRIQSGGGAQRQRAGRSYAPSSPPPSSLSFSPSPPPPPLSPSGQWYTGFQVTHPVRGPVGQQLKRTSEQNKRLGKQGRRSSLLGLLEGTAGGT